MKKIFLGLMLVFITAVLVVSCTPQQDSMAKTENTMETKELVIGFMGPLTGDVATYGQGIKKGVELSIDDSGIDSIKVIAEDTKCDAKEAVTAINKLATIDQVDVVIGEVCSGATLAAAPIAEQNGVVMISASATSPQISNEEWVFRTVPSDALQGAFGAELAAEMGYNKMAILYTNDDYGLGFNNVLEEEFPPQGGEVVASEAFERGSVDVRTQLTKIKSAEPDVVYVIANSVDSAVAVLKQIEELGIDATIIGSEGLKSKEIIEGAGEAAEKLILTSVSSGSIEFNEKHVQKYNEEPGPFAGQGYDAFKAIALAINQGASSGEEIKAMLQQIEFEGVTGTIGFDASGDLTSGNYEVFVVENGEFVIQEN